MNKNTPTVTQVSLTKYITHKESPFTQIGQKDSKKRKKNSSEIPPDKRHHESKENSENMSIDPQNNDLINTQVNTQNNRLIDGETPKTSVNTRYFHSFGSTLHTAMESMTSAVTRLIESNEAMIKHKETMDDLTQENRTLATRINRLENEHYKLKDKFDRIENKELEHSTGN